MTQMFTFAGISRLRGIVAYRFANTASRVRGLERSGHSEIDLRRLPNEMTKEQAIAWLNEQGVYAEANRVTAAVVAAAVTDKPADAPRVAVQRKTRKLREEVTVRDDGFVEPKEEWIQVAMCLLARKEPDLTSQELFDRVMAENG
jgi:hypothetical protein